jgi:hypothetical protein
MSTRALLAAAAVVASAGFATAPHGEQWRTMSMDLCDEIKQGVTLELEGPAPGADAAALRVANRTGHELWFPAESTPAYRVEAQKERLIFWFGFFEQVYGEHQSQYMLPTMRRLPPGGELRFELQSAAFAAAAAAGVRNVSLGARVATRELPASRVRGQQPLEQYLQNSCVVTGSGTLRH